MTVLEGDGKVVLGLTDVLEVLVNGCLDVHGLERHAVGLRQFLGVALGAGGRAEARHGDSQNALAVEFEHVKRMYEHDESQRGIQAAGQADNCRLGVRMAQAGRQTGCLQRQDLLTALVAECLVRRNERRARETAVGEVVFDRLKRERELAALDRLECVHALTLVGEALKVDIRVNDALREHLALSQQRTVLRDEVVTRENKVLRGLAETGVRIQVGAQQAAGLLAHEVAAVARLADDLIRCGQVDDDVRTHLRERSRRRIRHPQVLADFYAEGEQRLLIALKNAVGHNRYIARLTSCISKRYALDRTQRICRYEMALLVELGIVRNVRLGDEGEHLTGVYDSSHIVQLTAHAQRQTDYDDSRKLCGFAADGTERLHRALEQHFLKKQVAAGVAGQAQLGERDELRALRRGLLCLPDDFGGVIFAVRNVQVGCRGGDFDKSISHNRISSRCSDSTSIPCFGVGCKSLPGDCRA